MTSEKKAELASMGDVMETLRKPDVLFNVVSGVLGPVAARVMMGAYEQCERLGPEPYGDITFRLQSGKVAMTEITTKHRPAPDAEKKDEPKGPGPREQFKAVLQGQIDTLTRINKDLALQVGADSMQQLRENQAEIRRLTVELLNT